MVDALIDDLGLAPGGVAVDVGCGTGALDPPARPPRWPRQAASSGPTSTPTCCARRQPSPGGKGWVTHRVRRGLRRGPALPGRQLRRGVGVHRAGRGGRRPRACRTRPRRPAGRSGGGGWYGRLTYPSGTACRCGRSCGRSWRPVAIGVSGRGLRRPEPLRAVPRPGLARRDDGAALWIDRPGRGLRRLAQAGYERLISGCA